MIDKMSSITDNQFVGQFIKTTAFVEWVNTLKDRKGRSVILARIDLVPGHRQFGRRQIGRRRSQRNAYRHRPGYRVYYAVLEDTVILLGGDKSSQTRDIRTARRYAEVWKERSRK